MPTWAVILLVYLVLQVLIVPLTCVGIFAWFLIDTAISGGFEEEPEPNSLEYQTDFDQFRQPLFD